MITEGGPGGYRGLLFRVAILCKPAVGVPEHVVTMAQTLAIAARLHAGHPQLELALRLIGNTGVSKRHLVQPVEQALLHPGFGERSLVHEREARRLVPPVVLQALDNAGLEPADVDAIIYVSCTGFMMPSMTAWLCYQPGDDDIGSLLSDGLFGDAVAAAVVRGSGGTGLRLERNASYLVPGTEDWISFAVRPTGFHFQLDRRVPGTMKLLAPALDALAAAHGWDAGRLDFYIVHAGGPRILDDLSAFLGVKPDAFRHSRATLAEYGNIASAVVLDALRRLFEEDAMWSGAAGLVAGFGPGITAEMAVGSWVGVA
jgi:1,3,6,8-tetrahydroxynaphthalene synthase